VIPTPKSYMLLKWIYTPRTQLRNANSVESSSVWLHGVNRAAGSRSWLLHVPDSDVVPRYASLFQGLWNPALSVAASVFRRLKLPKCSNELPGHQHTSVRALQSFQPVRSKTTMRGQLTKNLRMMRRTKVTPSYTMGRNRTRREDVGKKASTLIPFDASPDGPCL
jgi:hypothetical protein